MAFYLRVMAGRTTASFRGSLGLATAGTRRQVLGALGAGSSLSRQPVCVLTENQANAGKLNGPEPHDCFSGYLLKQETRSCLRVKRKQCPKLLTGSVPQKMDTRPQDKVTSDGLWVRRSVLFIFKELQIYLHLY